VKPILRAAPARLIIFTVTLLALLVLLQIGARLLARAEHGVTRTVVAVVAESIVCAVMIVVYRALVRWFEGRPADELDGGPGRARLALLGVIVGTTLFTCVYGVLWSAGIVAYAGPGSAAGAVTMAAFAAAAALFGFLAARRGRWRLRR
jgi:cytochrome c biogenesis protein CcdA